jgi:hypothetical protein
MAATLSLIRDAATVSSHRSSLKLLTSNLGMPAKCTPILAARDVNISADNPNNWLATIADIVLRQTKGKRAHDKFHIDERGRSSAVGCNASDG